MGVVSHLPGDLIEKLVATGVDGLGILMDVEFPANFFHRLEEILLGPVHSGLPLPVKIVDWKREKRRTLPVQRTSSHDPRPAVRPVEGRVGASQVGKSLAPLPGSVAGVGGALEVGTRLDQGHFQRISRFRMNPLLGDVGGQNGSGKTGPDDSQVVAGLSDGGWLLLTPTM
jgi:hypothetical protein